MAKKQKSFADKAAGSASSESVYVKYVKSIQSEVTGRWRFNEQMVRMNKGEQLDSALKRMDEVANLVDIDLSEFEETVKIDNNDQQGKESLSKDAEGLVETDVQGLQAKNDIDNSANSEEE